MSPLSNYWTRLIRKNAEIEDRWTDIYTETHTKVINGKQSHMPPCDFLDTLDNNLEHISHCISARARAVWWNSMTFLADIIMSR